MPEHVADGFAQSGVGFHDVFIDLLGAPALEEDSGKNIPLKKLSDLKFMKFYRKERDPWRFVENDDLNHA